MKTAFFALVALTLLLAGCTMDNILSGETHGEALKNATVSNYCTALNTSEQYAILGYAEARDDLEKQWYGFIVCQRKNLDTGEWDVRVFTKAGNVTGSALTPAQATEKTVQANQDGKTFVLFGSPFNPLGKLDYRKIEYRLYQENGKPSAVEVFIQMRNADRTAKEPVTLKVNWPSG